MINSHHPAIAAAATRDDTLFDGAGVDQFIVPGMSTPLVRPPVFYRNEFGVVTNRRQFLEFYYHQLISGLPIGPHIFGRY